MNDYKLKRLMRIFAVKSAYHKVGSIITKEWVHVFFNLEGIEEEDYKKWSYDLHP